MNPSLFSQPSQFNFLPQQSMAVPQIGTFGSIGGTSSLTGGLASGFGGSSLTSGFSGLGTSSLTGLGTTTPANGLTSLNGLSQTSQLPTSQLPSTTSGTAQNGLQQIMQLVLLMVTMMLTLLGKNNPTAALDRGVSGLGTSGSKNQTAFKPVATMPITLPSANQVSASSRNNNVEQNAGERNALQNSLDKIAADPEGRALLAEAQKRGVTIEVGDPSKAAGSADKIACSCPEHQMAKDQGSVVNGVTISRGNKSHIVVRDPGNIKTIVHELVHAISTQDGNSQHEEGIADVVGKRVESRINGTRLENPNATYTNKLALYPELKRQNGIEGSLAAIGINAFA